LNRSGFEHLFFSALCCVQCPSPVREYNPSAPVDPAFAGRVLSVPKEMWRLCDWLFRHALDTHGLFARNGDPAEVQRVREALDVGDDFDDVGTITIVSTTFFCTSLIQIGFFSFLSLFQVFTLWPKH
jgi:hypothetical protein